LRFFPVESLDANDGFFSTQAGELNLRCMFLSDSSLSFILFYFIFDPSPYLCRLALLRELEEEVLVIVVEAGA
jgi:hypothetical protein